MKRPRIYKPRRGIRFDNRHVPVPDGGYLGAAIQVITLTGSVTRDIEQNYRTYSFDTGSLPLTGYPRSLGELFKMSSIISVEGSASYLAAVNAIGNGNGFDVDGENSYSVNDFNPNGFSAGVGKWTFPAFTVANRGDGLPGDFGQPWYAAQKYDGVSTSMTTASFEASPGPRLLSDLGIAPPVSGARADVDYALRLMNTGSFLYTNVTLFSQPSHLMVFKYTDQTVSFDIFSSGRADDPSNYLASHEMVSGTLRWSRPYSPVTTLTASIDPGRWYIVLALGDDQTAGSPRAFMSLSVIPLFGGEASRTTFVGDVVNTSFSASYIGDHKNYGASHAMQLSAFYLVTSQVFGGAGTGFTDAQMIRDIDAMMSQIQHCMSSQLRVKYKSSSAIDDSLTAFGTDLERQYLNQKLLGLGTGGLGRSFGVTSFVTGSTPSWTNQHIKNSSFVVTTLSSSDHEAQVLGYYRSGSQAVENSPVPASRSLYYSKRTIPYVDPGTGFSRTSAINYSRTYGVVLNTGTFDQNNYALICRLTGVLADISGSAPGWLLNNAFSMPWIPISSASLVPFSEQQVVTIHPQDVLTVRPILDGARRLSDAARDATPAQTLIQQFDVALSGTAT